MDNKPYALPWFRRRLGRWMIYAVALVAAVFITAATALQIWILPRINDYQAALAARVAAVAGQPVALGRVSADWDGLRPRLHLHDVRLVNAGGAETFRLSRVAATVAWRSLLAGSLRLHTLSVDGLTLPVSRSPDGSIWVAGRNLAAPQPAGSGLGRWLLRQPHLRLHNASLIWEDKQLRRPALRVPALQLSLDNFYGLHRYTLRMGGADGALYLSGSAYGRDLADPDQWRGKVVAKLSGLDPARLPLPVPAAALSGRISGTVWLDFANRRINRLRTDFDISAPVVHLNPAHPAFRSEHLSGRLSWQQQQQGAGLRLSHVVIRLPGGRELPPLGGRLTIRSSGIAAESELVADNLHLEAVARLAPHLLPLPPAAQRHAAGMAPEGLVKDLRLRWRHGAEGGQLLEAQGRFTGLGLQPYAHWPGVRGLSGRVDVRAGRGSLDLEGGGVRMHWPGVLRREVTLADVVGRLSWGKAGDQWSVRVHDLRFANADAAGTLSGTYTTQKNGLGHLDLASTVHRADARRVSAYLPVRLGESTLGWLDEAILGGTARDVRIRIRGPLAKFPFARPEDGLFQIRAGIDGGRLRYAPDWPQIDNISLTLLLDGPRLSIQGSRGNVYGMQIREVAAEIPDMTSLHPRLTVQGEAKGPARDMLKFISESPVERMIHGATRNIEISGDGHLRLAHVIPLRTVTKMSTRGSYRFSNNRISSPAWPALERVQGVLEFSQDAASVRDMRAYILGGPVTLQARTVADAAHLELVGEVEAGGLREWLAHPVTGHLRGRTGYKAAISWHNRQARISIESRLRGMAVDLPEPARKAAAEEMPLLVQLSDSGPNRDTLWLRYGQQIEARLNRVIGAAGVRLTGGGIGLGEPAPGSDPAQEGIVLSGRLPHLDGDAWANALFSASGDGGLPLASARLEADVLDVLGHRLHAVKLAAGPQPAGWQARLQSRELGGDIDYRDSGIPTLVAHLSHARIPERSPLAAGTAGRGRSGKMPVLDISAAQFQHGKHNLGRARLLAQHHDGVWNINDLTISSPEGLIRLNGLWIDRPLRQSTRLNLNIDVQDLGNWLSRLGYGGMIHRGTATVRGQIGWEGPPNAAHYPSMTGNVELVAARGQFMKIDPGLGKLLGILSLQSLPRRITLDFRDVFSNGFAFDDFGGQLTIHEGVLKSDNFRMNGPAARISMRGETVLEDESQSLRIRVSPAISGSVSVAGAVMGGPVLGLTSLILQKVLKDPIDQIASYEYSITGSWDKPVIARLGQPPSDEDPAEATTTQ